MKEEVLLYNPGHIKRRLHLQVRQTLLSRKKHEVGQKEVVVYQFQTQANFRAKWFYWLWKPNENKERAERECVWNLFGHIKYCFCWQWRHGGRGWCSQ